MNKISTAHHKKNIRQIKNNCSHDSISQNGGNNTYYDVCHMNSVKNKFYSLLFTHNTNIATLYHIITGKENYILCCDPDGSPFRGGKGAQFRYGLDSQYGDVIFIMKPNFYLNKRGFKIIDENVPKNSQGEPIKTNNPVFGHIFRNDFLENNFENQHIISEWKLKEALMTDFRPPSQNLNGSECRSEKHEWSMSWCNIQIHLAENIGLENIWKVYVPEWFKFFSLSSSLEPMSQKFIANDMDPQLMAKLVNNNLPTLPNGKTNPLNGKFYFYGPSGIDSQYLHYHWIKNIARDKVFQTIYGDIAEKVQNPMTQKIQTARKSQATTSTMYLSEISFEDLQKKYFVDLIKNEYDTKIFPAIELEYPMNNIFQTLLFTHNTPITTLYKIISSGSNYIRCCQESGHPIGKGAQFRYGLDSQYGDVIFIMKPNFWENKKGVLPNLNGPSVITQNPVIGHIFRDDFVEFKPENEKKIEKWALDEAKNYNFRQPTGKLNGDECTQNTWNVSWCNLQLHLGDNIDLSQVDKVYVPKWLKTYSYAFASNPNLQFDKDILIKLVNNSLPLLPNGQSNHLNGKFNYYGPESPQDHYLEITDKLKQDQLSDYIYGTIQPTNVPSTDINVQTKREIQPRGSSSTLFLSESAFLNLQKLYMLDLVRYKFHNREAVSNSWINTTHFQY